MPLVRESSRRLLLRMKNIKDVSCCWTEPARSDCTLLCLMAMGSMRLVIEAQMHGRWQLLRAVPV